MIFVESPNDFKKLNDSLSGGTCILQIILKNKNHPANNEPILLLIHHVENSQTFVLSFGHPDCIDIDKSVLNIIANTNSKKYIIDHKNSLYFANFKNCIDIGWYLYSETLTSVSYHSFRYTDIRSIPLMNILKKFNDTLKNILNYDFSKIDKNSVHFEDSFSRALYGVEKNGLCVQNFIGDKSLINQSGLVHSQYNMFTPTSRPSNRFGNINYAALNKSEGQRDCFVSRFEEGALVMMDYESYHLRLFGNHIKFNLPTTSVHEYLGKLYHGKDNLTEEEYSLSKKITFNLIYGGIDEDIKNNVPFMREVANFVDETWKQYTNNKFVSTWYYNRKLNSCLFREKEKPYVVFNYLLQSAETERNCNILLNLNEFLKCKKTKCILYTYDAFLFDIPKDEFLLIKDLQQIMNPNDDFPIKTFVGANYGDMVELKV